MPEDGLAPTAMNADIMRSAASAGLIITEGDADLGQRPGRYRHARSLLRGADRWLESGNKAVHARGDKIVVQLWHTGAISHDRFHGGNPPPAPFGGSRRGARSMWKAEGYVETSLPRTPTSTNCRASSQISAHSCRNALDAGFDDVELRGAHRYLLDSFLRDSSNLRTDRYGGSIPNRARFLIEVAEACAAEIGGDRLGVRLAPVSPANGAHDGNPAAVRICRGAAQPAGSRLSRRGGGATGGPRDHAPFDYEALRSRFDGRWMLNNGW